MGDRSAAAVFYGLNVLLFPVTLVGYVPRAFRYRFDGEVPRQYQAAARVSFYDQIVEHCLREMRQLVRRRDGSPRWKQVVEPAPGRFMHHLELCTGVELDGEVLGWLREARGTA